MGSAHHETQFEKMLEVLAHHWREQTPTGTILVKGSRFMKMERIVQWFVERYGSPSNVR
jgi:UDP-N-acetylmuramyl pentapeptide synthase